MLVKAMQDKLGRDPTDAELGTFKGALHSYEAANPTATTTKNLTSTTTHAQEFTAQGSNDTSTTKSKDSKTTPGTAGTSTSGALGTTTYPGLAADAKFDPNAKPDWTNMQAPSADQLAAHSRSYTGDTSQTASAPASSGTAGQTANDQIAAAANPAPWSQTSGSVTSKNGQTTESSKTSQGQTVNSMTNTTQSGGANPADWAQFYVQDRNRPEQDEYHKGTMYYNAALSALGISQGSL
jgi:hypothetical protein